MIEFKERAQMVNLNYLYTLYVIAFISVGPSLTLLQNGFRKKGLNIFLILPSIQLFFTCLHMLIEMNLAWGSPISADSARKLSTALFVFDVICTLALGWAYVLRLRVVIYAGMFFGFFYISLFQSFTSSLSVSSLSAFFFLICCDLFESFSRNVPIFEKCPQNLQFVSWLFLAINRLKIYFLHTIR